MIVAHKKGEPAGGRDLGLAGWGRSYWDQDGYHDSVSGDCLKSSHKLGKELAEGDVVVVWFGRPVGILTKILPYTGPFDFISGVGVFKTLDGRTVEMSIETNMQFEVLS